MSSTQPTTIFSLPTEIISVILAIATAAEKPEYTREPDGGWHPNGNTQFAIETLEDAYPLFKQLALQEHFHHNAHRAELELEGYLVNGPNGHVLYLLRAAVDRSTSTLTEDSFFSIHVRHLELAPEVIVAADVQRMSVKMREIVMDCAAVSDVTLIVDNVSRQHLAATRTQMQAIVVAAEAIKGARIRVVLKGIPLP